MTATTTTTTTAPTSNDLEPLHAICAVGYMLEVCMDTRDFSTWWVRPAGMVGRSSIVEGPFTQAEAMVHACNVALADLEAETGEATERVAVAR